MLHYPNWVMNQKNSSPAYATRWNQAARAQWQA
ncbi:DUF4113 domain-containing protein [Stenotrophomonas maltophilia]